jgi:hypothetical protein
LVASTDALEDKMMIGIELEEDALDGINVNVYEIEVDGVLYRRKHSEFEDEPDMMLKLGTFVLESVKLLEKENEALKIKLKHEEEKFVNETTETVASLTEGNSKA